MDRFVRVLCGVAWWWTDRDWDESWLGRAANNTQWDASVISKGTRWFTHSR